jgi:DNA-binding transcriptional MocR family regulator
LKLTINRNTVISVYDQLIAEGYLASKIGSGTHLSNSVRELQFKQKLKKSGKFVQTIGTRHQNVFNQAVVIYQCTNVVSGLAYRRWMNSPMLSDRAISHDIIEVVQRLYSVTIAPVAFQNYALQ